MNRIARTMTSAIAVLALVAMHSALVGDGGQVKSTKLLALSVQMAYVAAASENNPNRH